MLSGITVRCVCFSIIMLLGGCDSLNMSEHSKPRMKAEQQGKEITRRYWRRFLHMEPRTPEDYVQRGSAYYVFGDFEAARRDYDKAKGMYEAASDEPLVADMDARIKRIDEELR